ncbi:MAG: hypothetical protein C4B57_04725 [Deltaproteobacteria bacterium]|nr:MAG: hypothetical protein C4B57_04725 [Deltaproteobacteria bacterium]
MLHLQHPVNAYSSVGCGKRGGKYPVNPWSTVEVAIRALPQERFAFCRVSIAGRIALPLRSAISEL